MYIVHWTNSQGSALEPILMTIFLSDLLLVTNEHDLSSYVDDNIIHDYQKIVKNYFNGTAKIKWKEIQIDAIWLLAPMNLQKFEYKSH